MREDLNAVLVIRTLRAGLYGFGAVVIGEVLATTGYSPFEGLVLTSLLAGMGISSVPNTQPLLTPVQETASLTLRAVAS